MNSEGKGQKLRQKQQEASALAAPCRAASCSAEPASLSPGPRKACSSGLLRLKPPAVALRFGATVGTMTSIQFPVRARTLGGLGLLCVLCALPAQAQLARKPSYYEADAQLRSEPDAQRRQAFAPTNGVPASPAPGPAQVMGQTKGPGSLPALTSRAEFDRLARVHHAGAALALAHVMFVIDLKAHPAKIYYVNTPRYELHSRFVREAGLVPPATTQREIDKNYGAPARRFLFGSLSWQSSLQRFTYEFWEGDLLTPALLRQAEQSLKASFFAPVQFKTNSTLHERRAQEAGVEFVTQEALIRDQPYLPLNVGRATGRLRIIESGASVNGLLPGDIALLRQVPLSLPPVAGALREHDGQWVELKVSASGYLLRRLTPDEAAAQVAAQAAAQAARHARAASGKKTAAASAARPDLREQRLLPLADLRQRNHAQCGAKAANLGALQAAKIAGTRVPDGFCIPFAHYERFMRANGLDQRLERLQREPGFQTDPQARLKALEQLRAEMLQWPVDASDAAQWKAHWQSQLNGQGVFVRSSSNSEDLPGFSGAGLYTTVPNVKTEAALAQALKTVWASVFNPEAWEARSAAGFDARAVSMAVFVQQAVDATSAGVMITRDPFDAGHRHITYISAKRGIGIRVVEGRRIAEQVTYSSWSKAIQVISRSGDDTALQLSEGGGVKEVPIDAGRTVLTDALVLRLARVADAVKRQFKGVDQDIEWAVVGDEVVLLQARPYVERR
jgi:hypothetical protein